MIGKVEYSPDYKSRRTFLKGAGIGAGSLILASQVGCKPKDLSSWVVAIVNGFSEIKTFLPDLGLSQSVIGKITDLLAKGSTIATQFDVAYKAGKFSDAAAIFNNLGSVINDLRTTLGVGADNKFIKITLAGIGVARVAIALLLDSQGQNPQVLAKVSAAAPNSPERHAVTEVQRLASTDLNKLLAALP